QCLLQLGRPLEAISRCAEGMTRPAKQATSSRGSATSRCSTASNDRGLPAGHPDGQVVPEPEERVVPPVGHEPHGRGQVGVLLRHETRGERLVDEEVGRRRIRRCGIRHPASFIGGVDQRIVGTICLLCPARFSSTMGP
ncbi:hypothetical protein, partial [Agromyces humi]|uniref:hypothetical protein n=1 Tax=Agromyces humi TaxID=1766800 RepID=UPI00193A137C